MWSCVLLSLLGLTSCWWSEHAVEIEKSSLVFEADDFQIRSLEEIVRPMGRGKEDKVNVTMALSFRLSYPSIQSDVSPALGDAWLLRVRRGAEEMESIVIRPTDKGRTGFGGGANSEITLNLAYSYFYPSERLKLADCPVVERVRKVLRFQKIPLNVDEDRTFALYARERYHGELSAVSSSFLRPLELSIGPNMSGHYIFEVALLKSHTREVMSEYYRLNDSIFVEGEEMVIVPGCSDFSLQELRDSDQRVDTKELMPFLKR